MSHSPSTPPESNSPDEVLAMLQSIRGRLRALTVAVLIMALALMLTAAAVHGSLANWFGNDPLFVGGASVGAAVLGFAFGWFARRFA